MSVSRHALSPRRQRILAFLNQARAERGITPTIRDIRAAAGLASTSTTSYHLKCLEEAGYIRRQEGDARSIVVVDATDPASDYRAVIEEAASDLDGLAQRDDLDADTLRGAIEARAAGLRAALETAGVSP